MEPSQALRRIAYLLEEQNAESYRVRAFRRAASSVDSVSQEELLELDRQAQLTKLPQVGETTARVISETLRQGSPDYLLVLEGERPAPLRGPAAALRDCLQGDCHTHSEWSDGGSPIQEMAESALALGHRYLALTDHSPRLKVARGLSPERLRSQLQEVARLNDQLQPFRILTGIEVDILDDGSLDQEPELLAELDLVVASVHSKLRMERAPMTERLLAAVANPQLDVLGHCTGRLIDGKQRPPSEFDAEAVFAACAASGCAVEINSRPERRDPPPELLELARRHGCLFAIDTDAHAPGQLEWLRLGCAQAAEAGVEAAQVINSWSLERLLGWAAGRGARVS